MRLPTILEALKVIHTDKKLFCYVALICNLVQEFNGLVSKGLVEIPALLLFNNQPVYCIFFLLCHFTSRTVFITILLQTDRSICRF